MMAVSLGGRRITGTNFPYTNDAAKPKAFVLIPPAKRIISVQDANYRLSKISGNFLVYKNKQIKIRKNGDRVIEVICYWYTWRPPKKKSIRLILRNNETDTISTAPMWGIVRIAA
jgi:hypothetical protein